MNIRRACALAAACATAATPHRVFGQTIGGADSVAVVQLRNLIRQSSLVEARRAAVAAAEARVPAAGALGPAVLSAELEEVPDGLDVTDAGSFRLDLVREVSGGGRRAASRAVAGQAVGVDSGSITSPSATTWSRPSSRSRRASSPAAWPL